MRGHIKQQGMFAKEFVHGHMHSVKEQCQMGKWGKRRMRANQIDSLIKGKVILSSEYSLAEI